MKNNATIENREARHNYFVDDTLECGIVLRGNEVKSIRCGMMSLKGSWINIENGQMILKQAHITPYDASNRFDTDADRDKILLAHRREINKWYNAIKRDGYTLIPLKVYFDKNNRCKVLVGLCKGKHNYDKRNSAKEADAKRSIQRAMKND
jgi:SsrA-binding protein